jgi:hypothetical protein
LQLLILRYSGSRLVGHRVLVVKTASRISATRCYLRSYGSECSLKIDHTVTRYNLLLLLLLIWGRSLLYAQVQDSKMSSPV